MAQILDPLPTTSATPALLCCYVNATSKIQVARITNIPNWYFERVVFPGQRLIFEAMPESQLEIHTGMMASAILSDRIPCEQLQVTEGGEPEISSGATVSEPGERPIPDRVTLTPESGYAASSYAASSYAASSIMGYPFKTSGSPVLVSA